MAADAASVVVDNFVEIECFLASEADFSDYVFGIGSKIFLLYLQ